MVCARLVGACAASARGTLVTAAAATSSASTTPTLTRRRKKLSYSVKTIEKRVTAISQKLGLPHPDDHDRSDVNLRVLAVLAYLRSIDHT
jgi:hypothetical protein